MARFKQGWYTPLNPEKYVGDITKIRYMSSWELAFNRFLDNNPNILRWASEEIAIPYIKPTDGKVHRYFPDYWIEYNNKAGEIVNEIIEIKPKSQTRRSKTRNPKSKLYDDITFAINTAKWQYAQKWCNEHNMRFHIITEGELFK